MFFRKDYNNITNGKIENLFATRIVAMASIDELI